MFIKETPTFTDIKKNVPNRFWLKASVYLVNSFVCFASSYSMVLVQKMIDIVTEQGLSDLTQFYITLKYTIMLILAYLVTTYLGEILSFFLGLEFSKNTLTYLFRSFYKQPFLF